MKYNKNAILVCGGSGTINPITDRKGLNEADVISVWNRDGYINGSVVIGSQGHPWMTYRDELGILDYDYEAGYWMCLGVFPKKVLKELVSK